MREIGTLKDREQAEKLSSYLNHQNIDAVVREGPDTEFSVWAYNEDQTAQAEALYLEFCDEPNHSKFDAPKLRSKLDADKPKFMWPSKNDRSRYVDVRSEIFANGQSRGTVTLTLIITSVLASLLLEMSGYEWLKSKLLFSEVYAPMFYEIKQGQIWRLFTPIFLHGGFFHLLFNMWWLYDLGNQIEQIEKPKYMAALVAMLALTVNMSQYLVAGPAFIGMSGVVYGLFAYVWIMSMFQYRSRYTISQSAVYIMVGWLVICLLGIIPNVANTQHVIGLLSGALWAYIRSGGLKSFIRSKFQH